MCPGGIAPQKNLAMYNSCITIILLKSDSLFIKSSIIKLFLALEEAANEIGIDYLESNILKL